MVTVSAACQSPKALRPSEWLEAGLGVAGAATEARVHQQLLPLCGYWRDQKGSIYRLLPGNAHGLHVHTVRPSGYHRFTEHLVRLVLGRGQLRVVWGAGRYTLTRSGLDAISWRGRNKNDQYKWVRVTDDRAPSRPDHFQIPPPCVGQYLYRKLKPARAIKKAGPRWFLHRVDYTQKAIHTGV